jgi:Xanthine/uracil permeases
MAERPAELTYSLDERPPWQKCLLVAAQHVAVICPTLVIVAIIAHGAGESGETSRHAMARALIAVALMTVFQAIRFRGIGSGYFLPPVVTATYLPASLSAGAMGGPALVAGMTIFGGVVQMLFSRTIRVLRKVFPAVVSGVILMAVAMELCQIGMGVVFDPVLVVRHDFSRVASVALATLLPIVVFGVWGRGLCRLLCALIGIIVGYGAAAVAGLFTTADLSRIAALPAVQLPSFAGISFAFSQDVLVVFLIAAMANGLRAVGVLTTCQQLNDASWKRSDIPRTQGGVLADGLGCAVCGLMGTAASAASPSLVGLQKATGVTSRVIAWYVAGLCVVLACLPMPLMVLVQMPKPVMGAALFFNGAMMFVAGLQVALSRPLTLRGHIVIGFSVMLGVGVLVFPEFFHKMPPLVRQLTNSPIAIAVVSAVGLNLFFLLGRWRYSSARFEVKEGDPRAFLEREAKLWKIPEADLHRIVAVVGDVLSTIHPCLHEGSSIDMKAGFDGYDVKVQFSYTGTLPALVTNRRPPRGELVEEQSFAAGLSGYLSGVQADRVDAGNSGDRCKILLLFNL